MCLGSPELCSEFSGSRFLVLEIPTLWLSLMDELIKFLLLGMVGTSPPSALLVSAYLAFFLLFCFLP